MKHAVVLVLVLGACGPGGDAFDGPVALAILPDDFDMSLDRSIQLQVALRNEAGDYFELDSATFRYDAAKLRISDEGVAEPLVTGDVTFEAEAEGFVGSATFHVMDRKPIASIPQTMAVGEFEACFIGTDSATYCFDNGLVPQQRSTQPYTTITGSSYQTCALRTDGTADCGFRPASTISQIGLTNLVSIATGRNGPTAYYCGITTAGELRCEGSTPFNSGVPQHAFSAISKEARCAITSGWLAYCGPTLVNGAEDLGATGTDGFENEDGSPAPVRGNQFWQSIADGGQFACGIDLDGAAYCWGKGRLGSNETPDSCGGTPCQRGPALVSGNLSWAALAADDTAICGLTTAGIAYCWGGAYIGGGASPTMVEHLTLVAGGHVFTQIDVGRRFSCATTASGELWCWGLLPGSSPGQHVLEPVKITTPVPVKSPT